MGFLRKKGPKPAEVTQYTGLQIQTSSPAVPIPILYGNNKLAPNLLWYGGFLAVPEYSKSGSGGKGGGSKQTLSGYHYYAGIILGLCEGPIVSVSSVLKDQGQYSAAALNFSLVQGYGSSPTLAYQSDITYQGVAYVVSASYDLGSSATLGALQFELSGLLQWTAAVNAYDADPAYVIYDFLTSAQYGVGFPAGSIDATTLFAGTGHDYQTYCWAARIAISPVLENREAANSILARWLQLTNSAAVWSEGKLKFIPYADANVYGYLYDGTPVTFTANVTPVCALTDDDFVVGGPDEDPVLVERKDPYATYNVQQIEISDRWNNFNSSPVMVWDQNAIELYGRRDGSTVTAHEICDTTIAQTVAQLILQREVYIRNTYSFKLSFEFCLLEPMDIVTLTDSALGLVAAAVRILSIEEDDSGLLSVTAEEFPGATGTSATYPVQGIEAKIVDRNIVPSAVNPPVIFEPPSGVTNGQAQVWMAVSGGIATAWKLAEDSSTGTHLASETLASVANGAAVQFTAYVQAAERSACRLQIFDGAANQSADFDLSAGVSSGKTSGITAATIVQVTGSSWWKLTIACAMAAAAAPVVSILLENAVGTMSYAGTTGDGVHVWGAEAGLAGGQVSMIPMPMTATRATLAADSTTTPEGVEGTADPYWGGCVVYLSTDNVTYGQIGQINGPSRQGVTTAALGSADTILSVSLVESGGTLESASAADVANGATLSLVEDELLAFSSATLTGTNAYNLSGLVRGMDGTTIPTSHPSGSRFVRLDDAIFKYTLPEAYVGQTLYLKFQSFNVFGQGLQDLSTCAAYTYVPNGAGAGMGPIMSQLALGIDVDLGLVTDTAQSPDDDLGTLGSLIAGTVDLGGIT